MFPKDSSTARRTALNASGSTVSGLNLRADRMKWRAEYTKRRTDDVMKNNTLTAGETALAAGTAKAGKLFAGIATPASFNATNRKNQELDGRREKEARCQ